MRSVGTGESYVARPLPPDKYRRVCNPEFEIDWYCSLYGVPMPKFRETYGSRDFHGSYNPRTETVNYTKPYLGTVLHETAHHICHKLGLNGRGNWHDSNFGRILQEMIDNETGK